MVRRRSRRRKRSYRNEDTAASAEARIEDLSPRAQRLVESGVIDLSTIAGSGEAGRITSGDILHAARVMEMEQSVARIENVGRPTPEGPAPPATIGAEPDYRIGLSEPVGDLQQDALADPEPSAEEPGASPGPVLPSASEATMSSASDIGSQPIEVPPNPWDAYNGTSDGLSESALSGAEQSWGEAEANIAAIVEEAAARLHGRTVRPVDEPVPGLAEETPEPVAAENQPDMVPAPDVESAESVEPAPMPAEEIPSDFESDDLLKPPAFWQPDVEPLPAVAAGEMAEEQPAEEDAVRQPHDEPVPADVVPAEEPRVEPGVDLVPSEEAEVVMDFGTLEQIDPASVWEEGAEYFAPWFLAHSKQLGDLLGMEAGLSDARQYTTKGATGVLGRDDDGEGVIVLSSEQAVAGDPDLGRALAIAAASGASTVALVSARFDDEQLQALAWLNSQTKTGVKWFAIELKVVRIADSPPAMLFELVASPHQT